MASFENIFAQCVNDIQSGRASVDECLAAYPQHAGELAPMLGIHNTLAGVGQASLSPAADAAILAAMAAKAGPGPPPSGGGWNKLWPWTLILIVMIALAAVAAVATTGGEGDNGPASIFQSGSGPGDGSDVDQTANTGATAVVAEDETATAPADETVAAAESGTAPYYNAPTASGPGLPGASPPPPPAIPPGPAPEPPVAASDPPLAINEIFFNQSGGVDNEWVELFARTAEAVDITGWKLTNQDGFIFTFPAFTANPGCYVIVHTGTNSSNNTDTVHDGHRHHMYAGEPAHKWDNVADDVLLLDNTAGVETTLADGTTVSGRPVDYVTYGSSSGGQRDAPPVSSDNTSAAFEGSAPEISGPDKGTSVSLTPNGADSDLGSDWVESGESGTAGPSSEGTTNTP